MNPLYPIFKVIGSGIAQTWPFVRFGLALLLLAVPGTAWIIYAITHVPPPNCVEATGGCSQAVTAALGIGGFLAACGWFGLMLFVGLKFNSWSSQLDAKDEVKT